ncbi:MAG: putative thiamine-phosphate synthase 2 [Bryobacteraceae bacterium]|nr:MAG: putative thiamine-phosphate synthase 2 [Bryobacteraceae bacterium]
MIRCHITDRRAAGGLQALLALIERNARLGVEWFQVREKDLEGRALAALVAQVLRRAPAAKVIVNSRLDVALACGAAGLHLPADSPPPRDLRPICPPDFLIGVSCHTAEELVRAEREGADYALFSPVFRPLSKNDPRPVHGLDGLRRACSLIRIPVLALGGVTAENAPLCIEAGAAGIAGITLFQSPETTFETCV